MEVINKHSAYLTIGDLGFDNLFDREKRGDLGSVFRISRKNVTRISQGHRNPQGIVLLNNKDLILSEHGPKGGDEINIIESGVDYGWPFVTYGTEYAPDDYIIPAQTETHEGYRKPIKQWNPSIAPTELIQIPTQKFGKYSGGIAMGTLRENSLVFMRYENKNITDTEIVYIGARIRDLEVLPDKRLIASTDDGRLMIFTSPTTNK
jgi:glucose/arabinose dehydrogenase